VGEGEGSAKKEGEKDRTSAKKRTNTPNKKPKKEKPQMGRVRWWRDCRRAHRIE